jgi:hypothetical protein
MRCGGDDAGRELDSHKQSREVRLSRTPREIQGVMNS